MSNEEAKTSLEQMMIDDEFAEIFAAGAAAAVASHGVGIWNNPHLPALVAAQKRGDPLAAWQEKVDAWGKRLEVARGEARRS